MRHQFVIIGLGLLMFGGLCVLDDSIVGSKPAQPHTRGTSSVYMLAGEFRTVFANLMWIKADQYHHEYLENHPDWTKDTELLGMMNVITELDPHFVEAYSVGGALYVRGKNDDRKALKFLNRGMANNPRAWILYRDAALICALRMHDLVSARRYARQALDCCDDSFYAESLRKLVRDINRLINDPKQTGTGSRKAG